MKNWQKTLVAIVIIAGIVVGFVRFAHVVNVRGCAAKEEQSGRSTEYVRGTCLVEIASGLWVRDWEVVYYLDHVQQHGE